MCGGGPGKLKKGWEEQHRGAKRSSGGLGTWGRIGGRGQGRELGQGDTAGTGGETAPRETRNHQGQTAQQGQPTGTNGNRGLGAMRSRGRTPAVGCHRQEEDGSGGKVWSPPRAQRPRQQQNFQSKKKKKVSAPHSGEEGNLGDLIWTLKDEHFRANVFESEDNGTNV